MDKRRHRGKHWVTVRVVPEELSQTFHLGRVRELIQPLNHYRGDFFKAGPELITKHIIVFPLVQIDTTSPIVPRSPPSHFACPSLHWGVHPPGLRYRLGWQSPEAPSLVLLPWAGQNNPPPSTPTPTMMKKIPDQTCQSFPKVRVLPLCPAV